MLDLVRRFFGRGAEDDGPTGGEGKQHDIRVATCALLLEMAHADGEFGESERDGIVSALRKDYDLSEEYITDLLEAAGRERDGSIDIWRFTNLINQNYSPAEKIQIIEMVWKIAYTDGRLDKHEDYLVHKLAQLLRLDHNQLIEAKLKVKNG